MNRGNWLSRLACAVASAALAAASTHVLSADKVIRIVPHSNLTILDHVWTTAYITRNHGYMVYDTLFAMDRQGKIQPQMVGKWDVSKDKKVWAFTLRDGLEFHARKPVPSEDGIAPPAPLAPRAGAAPRVPPGCGRAVAIPNTPSESRCLRTGTARAQAGYGRTLKRKDAR